MAEEIDRSGEKQLIRSTVEIVMVLVTAVVLVWIVWMTSGALLLVFAGILIGILLHMPSAWLCRHTALSLRMCLAIVVLLFLAVVAAFVWLAVPNLVSQASQFTERLPQAIESVDRWLRSNTDASGDFSITQMLPSVQSLFGSLPNVIMTTFGVVGGFVVVVIVGLYLAADPATYREGLLKLIPSNKQAQGQAAVGEVGHVLSRFLIGQLIAMAFVGVLSYIGLQLLGVPLALSLALLTALLEFIPYLGPILATIPVVLVALTESTSLALWALLLYVGVQMVEGYAITPLIQHRAIFLPPALIIIAQVILGVLFGVLGILLATPIAAIVGVFLQHFYVPRKDALSET